jgi:hypothetical protein
VILAQTFHPRVISKRAQKGGRLLIKGGYMPPMPPIHNPPESSPSIRSFWRSDSSDLTRREIGELRLFSPDGGDVDCNCVFFRDCNVVTTRGVAKGPAMRKPLTAERKRAATARQLWRRKRSCMAMMMS